MRIPRLPEFTRRKRPATSQPVAGAAAGDATSAAGVTCSLNVWTVYSASTAADFFAKGGVVGAGLYAGDLEAAAAGGKRRDVNALRLCDAAAVLLESLTLTDAQPESSAAVRRE